jgi:uncharacterized protein YjbI with pentapeptide repeats
VAKCALYSICGLDASNGEHCILHAKNPDKAKQDFDTAFQVHLEKGSANFSNFVFPTQNNSILSNRVFPNGANFKESEFYNYAHFNETTFEGDADFTSARFHKAVWFNRAKFQKAAIFAATKFHIVESSKEPLKGEDVLYLPETSFHKSEFYGEVNFTESEFGKANFSEAKFETERADFFGAKFHGESKFERTIFRHGADFRGAKFVNGARFRQSEFWGRTVFAPYWLQEAFRELMFANVEMDFTDVTIDPLNAITFRNADLTKCRFLDTDVRQIEFTGITWPKEDTRDAKMWIHRLRKAKRKLMMGSRLMVYDEIEPKYYAQALSLPRIERLYRQLKQNYEERHDYERAGDFHYGEKQVRRKSSETGFLLKLFLGIYWLLSGYGERYLRPLIWAAILLIVSTFLYLKLGISPEGSPTPLNIGKAGDCFRAIDYSFRVMTLLKPEHFQLSDGAQWVNTFQTILGPILFGLFALALRQRLKR